MSKKIIYILLALIIVAGVIMTCVKGFNVDTMYTDNVRLYVYIQKEFENNDVKQIAKEVFGTDKIVVQKVEVYEDMAVITIKQKDVNNINVELKYLVEQLNTKINEKYEIENTTDDIIIKYEPKLKLTSILKPYIIPSVITTVIILIYAFIRYMKLGSFRIIGKYLLAIIIPELVYASVLVICRIPVNKFVAPIGLLVYAVSIVVVTIIKEKQLETAKLVDKK